MASSAPKTKKTAPYTRRYPRHPMDVRMNVQVFRQGEVSYFWGRSTELGLDGIGGTLTGELSPGEVVSMEFPLPLSPYPVKLRAIVRYRIGLHYGFEFLTPTPEQRIRSVLQRTLSEISCTASHSLPAIKPRLENYLGNFLVVKDNA
jgi:PilZ domain-containing protein